MSDMHYTSTSTGRSFNMDISDGLSLAAFFACVSSPAFGAIGYAVLTFVRE